ncbi:Canalicular multispecific organic anion transporter 2 [Dissophora ornata]|nr:Canalicular multispecific organic anion transporter 2 [Dissophora ornata]
MEDIQNVMPESINTLEGPYRELSVQWAKDVRDAKAANRLQATLISSNKKPASAKNEPNLLWTILRTFWKEMLGLVTYQFVKSLVRFLPPILLQQILIYIESPSDSPEYTRNWGIMLAVAMLAVNILASILMGMHHTLNVQAGIQVQSALISMIYRKALVLSPEARKGSSSGEITNHMSSDAEKWTTSLIWLPMWVSIPVEIMVGTYLLYTLLGWSAFCGLAMIVIVTPIQGWAGHFIDSSRVGKMEAQDSRVRLMTEILANIKIIKLYSYTEAFLQKVLGFRDKEVEMLRRTGTTDSFMMIIYSCMSLLMAFINFAVYATVGGPNFTPGDINAQTIFVSIALFGMLSSPIGMLSMVVEASISIRVSMRRIQGFLLKEEMDSSVVLRIDGLPRDTRTPVIQITDATLAWGPADISAEQASMNCTEDTETTALLSEDSRKAANPTLYDINASITRSSLTAIVGRVGQGKSSLLSAMIGDMYKRQGTIKIFGSIAYVPQQAWIINATLRDNIVFQLPFDQEKYDRIVHACGLLPDIEILPARDMTEIGERGINLSGGQKQRVSLARAAYQDADTYLFDDPLSAVDAHVDQHLWKYLIGPDGLLNKKTRVIVTHGIHHLEQCDHILVIKDGRVAEAGRYDSLMKAKKAFHQLIKEFSVTHKVKKAISKTIKAAAKTDKKNSSQDDAVAATITKTNAASASASASTSASATTSDDEDETGTLAAAEDSNAKAEIGGELIEEEVIRDSLVQWKTFSYYCKAMSYYYFIMTICLFVVWELLQLSVPVWLEHWISVSGSTDKSVVYFLGVYAFLVLAYMLIDVYLTYATKVRACMQASVALHNNALERVMVLPMSFFDSTPQGRILNRFSSDIACIDESIPFSLMQTVICSFNLIGNLLIISFATPIFMIAIPPLALLFLAIQKYYSRTSSVIKRLESTTRSPIYQHFSESLNGATCIRAMGLQTRFIADNADRVDKFSNVFYTWSMTNRWMNFRLECLATFVVFASTLLAVLNKGSLTPSLAGLALSFTLELVDHVTWHVRIFTRFQGDMVSVERVHEYSVRNSEAPLVTGVQVPENWPNRGHIVFKNYSARYREGLDLVLKNVSFEVQPAEKVGIVGRTGAGKSSLTLALFRIIEAADSYWARASEQDGTAKDLRRAMQLQQDLSEISSSGDGGSIEIDGLDISTLGLRDLRKHLAIIPQDPTLFAGTVRENLDPFNELEDAELWTALERAHLKDHITSLAGGLSFEVSQNGENFSVGQRSLICLARALLRKTKILILDEATAAVDVETDELIQTTIRKEFKDRTILTIAHRIKTVMDSDKILVLEKGQVEEYEAPKKLLRKKESLFYRLAEQAGEI